MILKISLLGVVTHLKTISTHFCIFSMSITMPLPLVAKIEVHSTLEMLCLQLPVWKDTELLKVIWKMYQPCVDVSDTKESLKWHKTSMFWQPN